MELQFGPFRYYHVKCVIKDTRIHIEKGPLSVSLLFHSVCVSLPVLSLSLTVSLLSYSPTLLLSLSDTFRASLSSSQSQFGISPRSRAGEVRGKKKRMQLCLLTCLIMCQIPLRVLVQTELGDSCPHICVLYPCMGPFKPSPGFKSFSCVQDSISVYL